MPRVMLISEFGLDYVEYFGFRDFGLRDTDFVFLSMFLSILV